MEVVHFHMNYSTYKWWFFRHVFIESYFNSFILKMTPVIVSLLVLLFRLVIEEGNVTL
jgi:hypothetical protein